MKQNYVNFKTMKHDTLYHDVAGTKIIRNQYIVITKIEF